MRDRILELAAERDEAVEVQELALSEVKRLQQEQAARFFTVAEQPVSTTLVGSPSRLVSTTPVGTPNGLVSTTPLGSPNRLQAYQESDETHITEEEVCQIGNEGEEELDKGTESYTEDFNWDDSEIF